MKTKALSLYKAYLFALKAFKASFSLVVGAVAIITILFYLIASLLCVIFLACRLLDVNVLMPTSILIGILAVGALLWILTWIKYIALQFSYKPCRQIDYDVFSVTPDMIKNYSKGLLMSLRAVISSIYFKADPYYYCAPSIALDKKRIGYCSAGVSTQATSFTGIKIKLSVSFLLFIISILFVILAIYYKYYMISLALALISVISIPFVIFFNTNLYCQLYYNDSDKLSSLDYR